MNTELSVNFLPNDCCYSIFQHLKGSKVLKILPLVCQNWKNACEISLLWKMKYSEECPTFVKPINITWKQFYLLNKPGTSIKNFHIQQNHIWASWGNTIAVWRENQTAINMQFTLAQTKSTHQGSINFSCGFLDGAVHYLLTGASDKTIKVWTLLKNSITELSTVSSGDDITALGGNVHNIASGTPDGAVHIWENDSKLKQQKYVRSFSAHKENVNIVQFDKGFQSSMFFTGGKDGKICVFNKSNGNYVLTQSFEGHKGGVSAIAYTSRYNFLFTGGAVDKTIKIWKKVESKFEYIGQIENAHQSKIINIWVGNISDCLVTSSRNKTKFWTTKQNLQGSPDVWTCQYEIKSSYGENINSVQTNAAIPMFANKHKIYRLAQNKIEVYLTGAKPGHSEVEAGSFRLNLQSAEPLQIKKFGS